MSLCVCSELQVFLLHPSVVLSEEATNNDIEVHIYGDQFLIFQLKSTHSEHVEYTMFHCKKLMAVSTFL